MCTRVSYPPPTTHPPEMRMARVWPRQPIPGTHNQKKHTRNHWPNNWRSVARRWLRRNRIDDQGFDCRRIESRTLDGTGSAGVGSQAQRISYTVRPLVLDARVSMSVSVLCDQHSTKHLICTFFSTKPTHTVHSFLEKPPEAEEYLPWSVICVQTVCFDVIQKHTHSHTHTRIPHQNHIYNSLKMIDISRAYF